MKNKIERILSYIKHFVIFQSFLFLYKMAFWLQIHEDKHFINHGVLSNCKTFLTNPTLGKNWSILSNHENMPFEVTLAQIKSLTVLHNYSFGKLMN